ncbi:hypothetical protein [Cytobacillus citreus]|uniref:hypothetical protein n=1 Tax=Cytobacillus citreus TaxID=2833586 RepID=UPI002017BA44|nr:hypothetical protein [Cytobacillus citreus]
MMPYSGMSTQMYSGQMMPYAGMPSQMYSGQMMPYSGMSHQMYSGQMMPTGRQNPQMVPHPVLTVARQTAPNQIEITYDQPTDLESATNVRNYWIRNNLDRPSDIATVERGNMNLLPTNSLTPNMVRITPVGNSKKRFLMTFNLNATPGVQYTVLPCFVNLEGRTEVLEGKIGVLKAGIPLLLEGFKITKNIENPSIVFVRFLKGLRGM